jgi:hypothetical protein
MAQKRNGRIEKAILAVWETFHDNGINLNTGVDELNTLRFLWEHGYSVEVTLTFDGKGIYQFSRGSVISANVPAITDIRIIGDNKGDEKLQLKLLAAIKDRTHDMWPKK